MKYLNVRFNIWCKFYDYSIDTYISEDTLFLLGQNIHLLYPESPRNNCESSHSKFKSYFYTLKPNIYQLFTKAVKGCKGTSWNLYKMRCNFPTSKITVEREQFLNNKMMFWQNGNLNRLQFVRFSLSFCQPIYKNLKNTNFDE